MEHTKISDWIEIDWNSFKTERNEMIHGVKVKMFVSPYDVPKAVRGHLDKDERNFIIELKYLNEEPTNDVSHNEYVTYKLGKFSRRLYAIKFDISAMQREGSKLNLTKRDKVVGAINKLLSDSNQESPKDNYELVRDAIKANSGELLAAA